MSKENMHLDNTVNASQQRVVLQCNQVTKCFLDGKDKLTILNGINLTVQAGEQIAIMGRSGSGKTTLLQLLGGLDIPSAGSVTLMGQDYKQLNEVQQNNLRNKSLGFIYQFHHLLPEFSAVENVAMPLLIGDQTPQAAIQTATNILVDVGLGDRLDHRPNALSGGERQRVAIARALVCNPACVLADEPTGNLDTETTATTFEIMQQMNRQRNTTFVIVTHDPELAARLDKTYLLENGQLIQNVSH